ncbi:MAG: hypothetical protein LUC46_08315 [Akkermansia sp.]|nr:hypothetical protein [Akkermansia sp.]
MIQRIDFQQCFRFLVFSRLISFTMIFRTLPLLGGADAANGLGIRQKVEHHLSKQGGRVLLKTVEYRNQWLLIPEKRNEIILQPVDRE